MKINSLSLRNFRNYESLDISFNPSRNIIVGENAQGKTNLVESVYMCSFARSFRTSNSTDLVMFGKDMCLISADIESSSFDRKIGISVTRQGKKMIKKDGKPVSRTAELLNNLVVVIFSPEDLRIIKDSPDKRRNFINKEISQLRPRYFECLKNYNDALKQKNALLKNDVIMDEMLDIYDSQLAYNGYELVKYRRNFVDKLSACSSELQSRISQGRETLEITYSESCRADSAEQMMAEFAASREKDRMYRSASIGPHRDDLEFFINGKDARKFGSQGQQRTIALCMKLAEVRIARDVLMENPVLILDDVLSELDIERQKFLLKEIDDVQLFITSTELGDEMISEMKDASIFNVSCGNITESTNV
ncbi:MAG: DNA replication/repair protein RecF [Firmicutes bacterium]|nr:DNA replication/repair protein RecF [Bacillota bacterium]